MIDDDSFLFCSVDISAIAFLVKKNTILKNIFFLQQSRNYFVNFYLFKIIKFRNRDKNKFLKTIALSTYVLFVCLFLAPLLRKTE